MATQNGAKPYLLIVAQSARMLAQAARVAGFRPLVIDLFADVDTRIYAEECIRLFDLSKDMVEAAITELKARHDVQTAVYGTGFEYYPESLELLCSQLKVHGNPPKVFARVQDKKEFFKVLKQLDIPFPKVSFSRPEDNDDDWLQKSLQGHGGVGILRYDRNENIPPGFYWQKYQAGVPHSVLFLADGKQCQVIGFNRQWTVPMPFFYEFAFSGLINHTELTQAQKTQISSWLSSLVSKFNLKGLNSMDFIQDGEDSYVLEINPRPPASMQVYEGDLFNAHIKACRGELVDLPQPQNGICGLQIVYAHQDVMINEYFQWPDGSQDIPHPGSVIGAGQPICSIIVHGKQPQQVMEGLTARQEIIAYQLIKRY